MRLGVDTSNPYVFLRLCNMTKLQAFVLLTSRERGGEKREAPKLFHVQALKLFFMPLNVAIRIVHAIIQTACFYSWPIVQLRADAKSVGDNFVHFRSHYNAYRWVRD